jgi:hypothetical protein
MRTYLREELRLKACIVDTQMEFGELSSLSREAGSDLSDAHAYWQHPTFTGKQWDPANWVIQNTPMVNDLADGNPVALSHLATYRVAGKPFSVSEYNHPAPSDFQVEMMPFLSTYAALQDWDMICPFAANSYGSGEPHDRIQGFFELMPNPAKDPFFPSAALIFRAGGIAPLASITTLRVAASSVNTAVSAEREWSAANGGKPVDLLTARLQCRLAPNSPVSYLTTLRARRKTLAWAGMAPEPR